MLIMAALTDSPIQRPSEVSEGRLLLHKGNGVMFAEGEKKTFRVQINKKQSGVSLNSHNIKSNRQLTVMLTKKTKRIP